MVNPQYIYTIIYLYVCIIFNDFSADGACDKSKCKGPLKYYEDINCVPTYGSEDSCCPIKYNCQNLEGRSVEKCYFNGHVYNMGETLREEDAKPCDINCVCGPSVYGRSRFSCAIVDCFHRPEPGCYLKESLNQCCPGPEICPERDTDIPRCTVDGKTYLDGQRFTPQSDPTLNCVCSEGYEGKNVEPFCKHPEPFSCDVELRQSDDIYNNCTPVFYSSQNPATDCNFFSRCQNPNDKVVKPEGATATTGVSNSGADFTCRFGNLTMNVGDELNSGTDYSSVCLKCVCEVPPLPTCQRLPDNECDVTVHPNFD
ncbi:kielin/chordin-like protein isoform X1 [Neodiprion fabricii]|uniref:kielin/chordin-like protein isoform X1 n=1 Tax=Neodiprion fabricii TaxID=2872261 RepID=UPI001ED905F9|nr:kielin/chordin-like protein isoform X1 [Neodiprion fabricii]